MKGFRRGIKRDFSIFCDLNDIKTKGLNNEVPILEKVGDYLQYTGIQNVLESDIGIIALMIFDKVGPTDPNNINLPADDN